MGPVTRSRIPLVAACAIALLAAGCAGAPLGTPTSTSQVAPTIHLTGEENGSVVHAPTGDLVVVTLEGTSWQFDAPSTDVLVAVGTPRIAVGAECSSAVVGSTCGTITATFHAVKAGTSVITAHRFVCGEAMRCTGSNGSYLTTVKIGHG